jgi:hypothetical protein
MVIIIKMISDFKHHTPRAHSVAFKYLFCLSSKIRLIVRI